VPTCRVDWPQAWRIIASRYPPIRLFERLTDDPAIWDALLVSRITLSDVLLTSELDGLPSSASRPL
jgi:hypothetical protein